MDSVVVDRDNRQWRAGDNEYRRVTIKGADPTTFKVAQLMQYDPADDKWAVYTGALAADRATAVLNLDEDFEMAGVTEITASICIKGKVYADKLDLPAAAAGDIDARPNGAALSIREQLREFGILAIDVEASLTENNITA